MFKNKSKLFFAIILLLFLNIVSSVAQTITKVEVIGNDRISDDTIIMFSKIDKNKNIDVYDLNQIIKSLYDTNYFNNISVSKKDTTLIIKVEENPIIGQINFEGIKAKKIINAIKDKHKLKSRTSYNSFLLEEDKKQTSNILKNLGYYFPIIEISINKKENNIIDINYDIDIGKKAKIRKISFTGDKIFKDGKLKSIIISEEYKPWKFISGKKYLNENFISLDNRLLKNFYLNKGFYNVKINSSFAKIINDNEFELIFNINANKKYFFDNLDLELPIDFRNENYKEIYRLFNKIKGKPYSINRIEKILNQIDSISTNEQFQSTTSNVIENIVENKINLKFVIAETDKIFVEKINIFGNNVTRENVLRNQLALDEGDPFNDILTKKSINNIKNLNFFKTVNSEVVKGKTDDSKIINIYVEEKATGEIMAGAGFGTDGGSITLGVKENNYLGKGISLDTKFTLKEDSFKGSFSVSDPNYKNSDKLVYYTIQSIEMDKLTDSGYKTNKTGFSLGTKFEYYDDLNLGLGFDSFYEKIETDSTASTRQKAQEGDYFDNFLDIQFDYDKRNQKFQTTDGFRNFYSINLPLISETNTLTNTYSFSNYHQYLEKNIFKTSFYFKGASSVTGDDIKLSERIYIPSSKLRGFESNKVGPKDGNDYIGGNFVATANFTSTLPQILENSQSTEFTIFLDIANIWGVDYNSSLDNSNDIRSSIGFGLDWFSAIGPLNFSLSQPITKNSNDITESFRFNLGTTF